jgi:hypothetical protein
MGCYGVGILALVSVETYAFTVTFGDIRSFLYSFLGVKIIIGVNLVSYAIGRRAGMEARRAEDEAINNFERDPIGEGKEEQVCCLSLVYVTRQSLTGIFRTLRFITVNSRHCWTTN